MYPLEILRRVEQSHLNMDILDYINTHRLTDHVIERLCFLGFSPQINALHCDPE